jgi:hypothetical protein
VIGASTSATRSDPPLYGTGSFIVIEFGSAEPGGRGSRSGGCLTVSGRAMVVDWATGAAPYAICPARPHVARVFHRCSPVKHRPQLADQGLRSVAFSFAGRPVSSPRASVAARGPAARSSM